MTIRQLGLIFTSFSLAFEVLIASADTHANSEILRPGLEDVSILFPFPRSEAERDLLPSLSSPDWELLPEELQHQLPRLDMGPGYPIRVLSVRLDPCFATPSTSSQGNNCQAQIRLIAQPIFLFQDSGSPSATPTSEDAAFHLFFALTQDELREFLSETLLLRKQYQIPPASLTTLGVHRGLRHRGIGSAYYHDWINALKKRISSRNLSRVTFMVVRGRRNVWAFGGVDIKNGVVQSLQIPNVEFRPEPFEGLSIPLHTQFFRGFTHTQFLAPVPTMGTHVGFFYELLKDSPFPPTSPIDKDDLAQQVDQLHQIENPKLNNPNTVDCFSCHAAEFYRSWTETLIGKSASETTSLYQRTQANGQDPSIEGSNFRAFGYFHRSPSIMQRTRNETHEVLKWFLKERTLP